MVFENRVLRRIFECNRGKEIGDWRIFGPKREDVTGDQEEVQMRSFIICTLHHILLG
jgi:hypothetical protein